MHASRFEDVTASRRALLLGLAVLAAAPLAGCGSEAEVPALLVADGVTRNQPAGNAPVGAAVDALTPAGIAKVRAAFTEAPVEIAVPRWEFETSLDLATLLPGLGLRAAFGAGADFSGIADGLFLAQAVHKANISVDEWGTEAAAITEMSMPASAQMKPPIRFSADRPFAFAIVGGKDQVPIFVGRVSDPTAK
ncbi:serpin family protein [Rhizocola hellebori]|uniref:serpin family protein n=1 Tax=Rhizocola hellebori TaxID=1392758 RepID=UPI00194224F2|nr:serpin family protein [Rhizocola hellebori]